jgi:hypothetical protein
LSKEQSIKERKKLDFIKIKNFSLSKKYTRAVAEWYRTFLACTRLSNPAPQKRKKIKEKL